MATYTMQIREYIEQVTQHQPELSNREKIEIARTKLFNFDYPIFNEDYRKVFETNFIRKFYMREIGFETEGLFKFNLETWLLIHMPYFNSLFESELIEYDPLTNSKIDVTHNKQNDKNQNDSRNITGNSTTDGTNESTQSQDTNSEVIDDNFNRGIESDTPDGRLNLTTNDGEGTLEYASKINEDNENNKRNATGQSNGTSNDTSSSDSTATQDDNLTSSINEIEDFIQSRVGKIGVQSYSKMVQEYRQALLRVEKTIFDEMQELFMLVY